MKKALREKDPKIIRARLNVLLEDDWIYKWIIQNLSEGNKEIKIFGHYYEDKNDIESYCDAINLIEGLNGVIEFDNSSAKYFVKVIWN